MILVTLITMIMIFMYLLHFNINLFTSYINVKLLIMMMTFNYLHIFLKSIKTVNFLFIKILNMLKTSADSLFKMIVA